MKTKAKKISMSSVQVFALRDRVKLLRSDRPKGKMLIESIIPRGDRRMMVLRHRNGSAFMVYEQEVAK